MFLEERRNQILNYLDEHERATVDTLSGLFSVTRETIRSDLGALAKKGLVQRCHGGAIIVRRNMQAKLIGESGGHFEVLLQRLEQQRQHRSQGKKMRGNVCILGSFNVDIVAKVDRFPKGGESLLATWDLVEKALTKPWLQVGPEPASTLLPKLEQTNSVNLPSTTCRPRIFTPSGFINQKWPPQEAPLFTSHNKMAKT